MVMVVDDEDSSMVTLLLGSHSGSWAKRKDDAITVPAKPERMKKREKHDETRMHRMILI